MAIAKVLPNEVGSNLRRLSLLQLVYWDSVLDGVRKREWSVSLTEDWPANRRTTHVCQVLGVAAGIADHAWSGAVAGIPDVGAYTA